MLVGLPGTGKSSVAERLAARWGCAALDTDEVLSRRARRPVADVLREEGEPAFRTRELAALEESLVADAVVATGGGVVTTPEARALLVAERTVWLDAPDEVLLERLGEGDRPLLAGETAVALAGLRREREALYEAVSGVRVDADGEPDEVAQRVAVALGEP
ncbi:MAG: shikimate kinase [Acidobacteriota bacterium]|nr:shikimate kinase [Acidobacteriota bacterium]